MVQRVAADLSPSMNSNRTKLGTLLNQNQRNRPEKRGQRILIVWEDVKEITCANLYISYNSILASYKNIGWRGQKGESKKGGGVCESDCISLLEGASQVVEGTKFDPTK